MKEIKYLKGHDKSKAIAEYVTINGRTFLKPIAPITRFELNELRRWVNMLPDFSGFAVKTKL